MAIVFNSLFGTAQSKTAGTSLQTNPADITVVTGDDLFLAFASDDVGTAHSVAHGGTATISWTKRVEEINSGNAKAQLWRGAVTAGGTVTDVTISWTTNVTAKALVVGWFSGAGTEDDLCRVQAAGHVYQHIANTTGTPAGPTYDDLCQWQINDLVIGAIAAERPGDDTYSDASAGATWSSGPTIVGKDGTTAGGAASNMTALLAFGIASSDETSASEAYIRFLNGVGAPDSACAGAVYSPTVPTSLIYTPRRTIRNL